jgi:D-glycero-D-manno-heptose 1,7-bisphosphate phosphatase
MQLKLAVLDKDGTLTTPKSGSKFIENPTDQILLPGVFEGCQRLIAAGFVLTIATNQGGVAAGHKTLDDAVSELRYCLHLLSVQGISIGRALLCPDFEGRECFVVSENSGKYFKLSDLNPIWGDVIGGFRKPDPGMLRAAVDVSPTEAWMVGDREEDRLAAEAAGFNFLNADEWRNGASPWII